MDLESEFWAAIAGAVVGGVIALGIQLLGMKAARSERETERKEARKALAVSTMFKAIRIHSNIAQLRDHLNEAYEKGSSSGSEPWAFVLPLASLPDAAHFSDQEMAMVLSLKDSKLLHILVSLDAVHNSLLDLFRFHAERRAALLEQLPPPTSLKDRSGETSLSEAEAMRLRPRMVELNLLLDDLRPRVDVDYRESREAIELLRDRLKEKLGLSVDVEFLADKPSDGAAAKSKGG